MIVLRGTSTMEGKAVCEELKLPRYGILYIMIFPLIIYLVGLVLNHSVKTKNLIIFSVKLGT
jgi:hypothetical protein